MKTSLILILLLVSQFTIAAPVKSYMVRTPDHLSLSVQEWGNPNGKELVFIHGLGQSYLSWKKQYESSLAKDYRILTYDLRGHGNSDKPHEEAMYAEGKRWGEDLKAVLRASAFKKPVLIGWSLGGVIIENYLREYGEQDLAGVILVDAVVGFKPEFFPTTGLLAPMGSDDLEVRSTGAVKFLKACFEIRPTQAELELMIAFNGAVPAIAHRSIQKISMTDNEAVFKNLKLPSLIIFGKKDKLLNASMASYAKELMPQARTLIYPKSGHAPFFEEPKKFNEDIRNFIK